MEPRQDKASGLEPATAPRDSHTETNRFVLEAALLASSLAGISMRDEKRRIAQDVESGFQSYAELLRRKESLRLTSEDDRAIEDILQQIRTRLNYLKVWRIPTGEAQSSREAGAESQWE